MNNECSRFPVTCPIDVQQQLKRLCSEIQNLLADNLIGIYLHGSLAMGFFNPSHSDIDLLVVDRASIPPARKRDLGEFLLYLSNHPIPIEIHFLVYSDLHPWQYPPRFDFHYSEGWRARYEIDLQSDAWQAWDNPDQQDPDLGAHVAVARARGTVLIGPPVEMVFPLIPHADYLAAVRFDLEDAFHQIEANPVYHVLNICRTLGYLQTGRILSKAEGGEWAQANLPARFHAIISAALESYTHGGPTGEFVTDQLVDFARFTKSIMEPD